MDSWFALTCFSLNNFVLLGLHTCIVNLKKRWRRNQMVWSVVVCSATKLKHMQVFEWDECTTAPSLQNMYTQVHASFEWHEHTTAPLFAEYVYNFLQLKFDSKFFQNAD